MSSRRLPYEVSSEVYVDIPLSLIHALDDLFSNHDVRFAMRVDGHIDDVVVDRQLLRHVYDEHRRSKPKEDL